MEPKSKKFIWTNCFVGLITLLGFFQIFGDIFTLPFLKGIGAASVLSPFPKVFCDVKGLEPFASTFTLKSYLPDGTRQEQNLTPQLYQKIKGPYNRRNVYGAALSYAPRLPERLWTTVFCYGLGKEGPLLREFQLPRKTQKVEVEIKTNTRNRQDKWLLSPSCH